MNEIDGFTSSDYVRYKPETALRMLKIGKLTIEEIAECSELSIVEVEQLAGLFAIKSTTA